MGWIIRGLDWLRWVLFYSAVSASIRFSSKIVCGIERVRCELGASLITLEHVPYKKTDILFWQHCISADIKFSSCVRHRLFLWYWMGRAAMVTLSWLQFVYAHFFRPAILTRKVSQTDRQTSRHTRTDCISISFVWKAQTKTGPMSASGRNAHCTLAYVIALFDVRNASPSRQRVEWSNQSYAQNRRPCSSSNNDKKSHGCDK